MSYYLEILSETSYQKFINQIDGGISYDNISFEEIEEFFDEAVIYDTSFAYGAGSDRLLDVINEAEPYADDFTKEFDHNVYRIRKNKLIKTIHESTNKELREKWAFAINNLQFVDDNEYLYLFID